MAIYPFSESKNKVKILKNFLPALSTFVAPIFPDPTFLRSLFKKSFVKIKPKDNSIKVPNIGWNEINYHDNNMLFKNLPKPVEVYFVHSYHMNCLEKKDIIATSNHGHEITAAINKENIYGTQFHPEKSQDLGLQILENFLTTKFEKTYSKITS